MHASAAPAIILLACSHAGRRAAARSRHFVAGCKFFLAALLALWLTMALVHAIPKLQEQLPMW
jgi:hypothetical protein